MKKPILLFSLAIPLFSVVLLVAPQFASAQYVPTYRMVKTSGQAKQEAVNPGVAVVLSPGTTNQRSPGRYGILNIQTVTQTSIRDAGSTNQGIPQGFKQITEIMGWNANGPILRIQVVPSSWLGGGGNGGGGDDGGGGLPPCVSSGSCATSCSRPCGGGSCQDNCGNGISCNNQECPRISGVSIKFNNSDGPVNLDGVQQGTLSWSVASYGGGSLSCNLSCNYPNTGETTGCTEVSGNQSVPGSRTISPQTTARYSINCLVTGSGTSASGSDSIDVNVMRYRCLFGLCQNSAKGTMTNFKYPAKNSCISVCSSTLPER